MRRILLPILGCAILLLDAAPPGTAAWLQAGYDAARTGSVPDDGPENGDIVFTLPVAPETRSLRHAPLIRDGWIFVFEHGDRGHRLTKVHRVNVSTAAVETILTLDHESDTFSMTRDRIIVVSGNLVEGFPVSGGSAVWATWLPISSPDRNASAVRNEIGYAVGCTNPAVLGETVYLACQAGGSMASGAVVELDARSGRINWTWDRERAYVDYYAQHPPVRSTAFGPPRCECPGRFSYVTGISVVGPLVLMAETSVPRYFADSRFFQAFEPLAAAGVWAFHRSNRSLAWYLGDSGVERSFQGLNSFTGRPNFVAPPAVGNDEFVFVELVQLYRKRIDGPDEPPTGADFRVADATLVDPGSGMALRGNTLYATSASHLHRYTTGLERQWSFALPPGEVWGGGGDPTGGQSASDANGPVVGKRAVWARTQYASGNVAGGSIYAVDSAEGRQSWSQHFDQDIRFAVGEGVMAVSQRGGLLTVLGRTAASIDPRFTVSNAFPLPGDPVTVDLRDSRPGVFGGPDEYRVRWGDGMTDDWAPSPVLTHRYGASADYAAQVEMRNAAGQTASLVVPIHVGGTDPGIGWLEAALLPRNQNQTFFVLGLLATALVALFGIVRFRLRQARLQRELRAIEEIFERNRSVPERCDLILDDRRAHVRSLWLRHKLDESQCQLLERRLDELGRTVRMELVDRRFEFLPLGMSKRLRAILEDTRVTSLERAHFLEALEREETMSRHQKGQIRRLVDDWFTRDAGRARTRSAQ